MPHFLYFEVLAKTFPAFNPHSIIHLKKSDRMCWSFVLVCVFPYGCGMANSPNPFGRDATKTYFC